MMKDRQGEEGIWGLPVGRCPALGAPKMDAQKGGIFPVWSLVLLKGPVQAPSVRVRQPVFSRREGRPPSAGFPKGRVAVPLSAFPKSVLVAGERAFAQTPVDLVEAP